MYYWLALAAGQSKVAPAFQLSILLAKSNLSLSLTKLVLA